MAQSGDKTWGVTRDDIITAALRKIGEYDSADGPSTAEKTDAALTLNALTKEWSTEGIGIWIRQRTVLFLNKGQPYYWLGPNPLNDTTNRVYHQACAEIRYKEAPLLSDVAASGKDLPVTDSTWLDINRQTANKPTAVGPPQCGVRLTDGTIHWSTVASAATGSVTLTDALPSGASAGAMVYSFLARTSRPIRLLAAYRTSTSGIDTAIEMISRVNYEQLTNKLSDGDPTKVCFESLITERTSSALHSRCFVWPSKNSTNCDRINLITEHYMDDLDIAGNNPQFPAEWANALIWSLAAELSFDYGLPARDRSQIMSVAESKKFNLINSADLENASVSLEPDRGR